MAGNLSVPSVFANQVGNVPASQLDDDYNAITGYVNVREVGSGTLAARPVGVAGQWYFAKDFQGGQLFFSAGGFWVPVAPSINSGVITPVPVSQGGTGLTATAQGNLLVGITATSAALLAPATNGTVLGTASGQNAGLDWVLPEAVGSTRLVFKSSTQVELQLGVIPLNVNGTWVRRAISTSLVGSTAGLSASTIFYVYAGEHPTIQGSTILIFSTVGHSSETMFGIETRTGFTTNTLVGMVRTNAAGQFADSNTMRFVASYFNRRLRTMVVHYPAPGGSFTTTAVTYGRVDTGTAGQGEFLTWGGEVAGTAGGGDIANSGAGGFIGMAVGLDGASTVSRGAGLGASVNAGSRFFWAAQFAFASVAEGFHFVTLLWRVNANTGTLVSGSDPETAVVQTQLLI